MKRSGLVILVLVAVLLIVAGVFYLRMRKMPDADVQTSTGPMTTAAMFKPKPIIQTFHGCPPSGDGGDPVLNTLKNRVDEGQWAQTTIASLLTLDWPHSIERQPRSRWSKSDAETIARNEGAGVQVEGYLVLARQQSPESCNCHSTVDLDYHIWLVDDAHKNRDQSVVIEMSPRVRSAHTSWTVNRLSQLAARKERVRVSGWLMMDPEHPDQIGKTRASIWEIHPVMQLETLSGGAWKPLDNGTTGVASEPSAEQTIPVITPAGTVTEPAVTGGGKQNNSDVQITAVSARGTGAAQADEYVEISNRGSSPVDMTEWVLQDAGGANFFKWESFTLDPGKSVRVYTNEEHSETGGFSFKSARPVWGNTGDVAELYDADKALVSRYPYGNQK